MTNEATAAASQRVKAVIVEEREKLQAQYPDRRIVWNGLGWFEALDPIKAGDDLGNGHIALHDDPEDPEDANK